MQKLGKMSVRRKRMCEENPDTDSAKHYMGESDLAAFSTMPSLPAPVPPQWGAADIMFHGKMPAARTMR
jgi:hypothetical protein